MSPKPISLPKGTQVPNHIAIVLDGNGRWARSRGLPATKGHEAGAKAVREVLSTARDLGVHTLTIWGFSTENWKRPPTEVRKIMGLIYNLVIEELATAHKEEIRLVHLGRKDRLPRPLMKAISKAEEETKDYSKYQLNLAIDYGGRDEIVRGIKRLVQDGVEPDEINEELFSHYLDTANHKYPDPDLFIRTSGEQRTSGLLPWQMVYSEYYFEEDHLPDMNPEKLKAIILDYSLRRRRFGAKDKVRHFKFKPELTAKFELAWWRLSKIPENQSFAGYTAEHLAEQWGLSKSLAKGAAKHYAKALIHGKAENWQRANASLREFYKLIKSEVKLAFEPKIAASLEVNLLQKINNGASSLNQAEVEEATRNLLAEVYRISHYQAKKAAHLRSLATVEKNLAERGEGEHHWGKAEEYLELYYQALKDRVA